MILIILNDFVATGALPIIQQSQQVLIYKLFVGGIWTEDLCIFHKLIEFAMFLFMLAGVVLLLVFWFTLNCNFKSFAQGHVGSILGAAIRLLVFLEFVDLCCCSSGIKGF